MVIIKALRLLVLGGFIGLMAVHAQDEINSQKVNKRIADLSNSDIAMSMYGENLTWGQLKALMTRDGVKILQNQGIVLEKPIIDYIKRLAHRVIVLHEVKKQNMTLDFGERVQYLNSVKSQLQGSDQDAALKQFIAKYPKEGTGLFNPNLDEMLMTMKFNNMLISKVVVTDDEIKRYQNQIAAAKVAVEKFNKTMRETLEKLINQPEAKTDEGFAKLAKENSEGQEADKGGLLGEFPRSFIAGANELEDFEYNAGENSKIIETKTAFRVIRVLAVLPPKKEGGEDILRISQILLTRYPDQEYRTPEQIKEIILRGKQMDILKNFANQKLPESNFSCPLFPRGVFIENGNE